MTETLRTTRAPHSHGPTAEMLDPVYCLTCSHSHIATIPAVTFACDSCGFGSWGHSIASAHADSYSDHVVFPLHHATTCVMPTVPHPTTPTNAKEAQA